MSKSRPALNSGKGLVARKPFRFAGKPFALGDFFPWRRLAVSERRLQQLWDAGYLRYPDGNELTTSGKRKRKPGRKATKQPKPVLVQESTPEPNPEPAQETVEE